MTICVTGRKIGWAKRHVINAKYSLLDEESAMTIRVQAIFTLDEHPL
jgi:hypothetical protein